VTKRIEFNWKKKQLTTTSLKLDAKDERDDDDDERLVVSMVSPSYSSFMFSLFFVTQFEKQTQRDLHRRREEEEE
jgi:hypothetical protein